jgi:hypothetical protein
MQNKLHLDIISVLQLYTYFPWKYNVNFAVRFKFSFVAWTK